MSRAKFQYDENGTTFYYFLLTFSTLVVIPVTHWFWPRQNADDDDSKKAERKRCHCSPCEAKYERETQSAKPSSKKSYEQYVKITITIMWIALAAFAYKVALIQPDYVTFDPFEILNVSPSASKAIIRKAYRDLSLLYHPDKPTGDSKRFIRIAKAYASLTDETARKNWEEHGNPDGPGAMSFGFALPAWFVEKENSAFILLIYLACLIIAVPIGIFGWLSYSGKYRDRSKVLLDTSQLYYYWIHRAGPVISVRRAISIIAASCEFDKTKNPHPILISLPILDMARELAPIIAQLPESDRPTPTGDSEDESLERSYALDARTLLFAHLHRLPLSNETLESNRRQLVRVCTRLIAEFVQCAAQMTVLALSGRIRRAPSLQTIENVMRISGAIVQAISPLAGGNNNNNNNNASLRQLPHITDDMISGIISSGDSDRKSTQSFGVNLHQLAALDGARRRALLRQLTDTQYDDVIETLRSLPLLDIDIRIEVLGEEEDEELPESTSREPKKEVQIVAEDLVTVTVTLFRRSLAELFDPDCPPPSSISPLIEIDRREERTAEIESNLSSKKSLKKREKNKDHHVDDDEDDEDAEEEEVPLVDAKHSDDSSDDDDGAADDDEGWGRIVYHSSKNRKNGKNVTISKLSRTAHAPHYPDDKQEYWWIYIASDPKIPSKSSPTLITVPFLVTNLAEREEIELKFSAPSVAGTYAYNVHVRSDSYLEMDYRKQFQIEVEEARQEFDDIVEHDDDDDEEEANENDEEARNDDELDDDAISDSDLQSDELSD